MSLGYAILGLLALKPRSGYELKDTFERSIHYIWNSTSSQIYETLKDLRRQGLVESELVMQTDRPNKYINHITPEGARQLESFVRKPLERTRVHNQELLQVFLSNFVDDDTARKQLSHLLTRLRQECGYLESVRDRVMAHQGARHRARYYQLLSLRLKIAELTAVARELEASLAGGLPGAGPWEQAPLDGARPSMPL